MSERNWRWPARLTAVAYNAAAAESLHSWGDLLEADTGMPVNIPVETEIVSRFGWVKNGQADMVAGFTNETGKMLQGAGQFAVREGGPFPARIVWPYSQSGTGFFVRGDSVIHTPRNIRPGMRMVHMAYAPGLDMFRALFAWAGLKLDDIVKVPSQTTDETAALLSDGKADICFGNPTTRTAIAAAKNPHGIRWIELNPETDPEGAARFRQAYPLVNFAPMSGEGVASSRGVWSMQGTNFLVAREPVAPDFIYHLVEWLDVNHARYAEKNSDNGVRTLEVLVKALSFTYLPCHAGLVQYLQEKSRWTEAHARRQQENAEHITQFCRAYAEAVDIADDRSIKVSPDNTAWVELWEGIKKERGLAPFKLHAGL